MPFQGLTSTTFVMDAVRTKAGAACLPCLTRVPLKRQVDGGAAAGAAKVPGLQHQTLTGARPVGPELEGACGPGGQCRWADDLRTRGDDGNEQE